MSRHLERLLLIDALLRTAQRPTTVSLAEALEVSERTVRSDLALGMVKTSCSNVYPTLAMSAC